MKCIKNFMKYIKCGDKKPMKCIKCGEDIPSYWYYKNNKKLCGDYTYIGYCATCEDFARYTGNL